MTLIVFSGGDAAGKSSIIDAMCRRKVSYQKAHWSDFVKKLEFRPDPAELVHDLSPIARSLFILLINFGLYEQYIKPFSIAGKAILCESYYLKFLAKERVYGVGDANVLAWLTRLPAPTLIVDVEIDLDIAFDRMRGSPSRYETMDSGRGTRQSFKDFQTATRYELQRLLADLKIPVLTVNGSDEIEHNVEIIESWISGELAARGNS